MKELHQRYLLDKLMSDTSLISSDTVYVNFMASIKQSPVYAYWQIDSMIIANDTMPATISNQMDSFYHIINSADSVLAILDSLQLTLTSVITLHDTITLKGYAGDSVNLVLPHGGDSSLQSQLNIYKAISDSNKVALNNLQNSWLQSLSTSASAISSINTALTDTSLYESYQQNVKAIYLHSLGAGIDTFSTSDIASLYSIASLCPYAGGTSVYQAQALYSLITPQPFLNFDCDGRSERMLMRKPADTVEPMQVIKLYPNPASDKLLLQWQGSNNEIGTLTIEDVMGRNILTQQVSSNTGPQTVDIGKLSDGTYVVWLKEAGRAVYQTKVIIIK